MWRSAHRVCRRGLAKAKKGSKAAKQQEQKQLDEKDAAYDFYKRVIDAPRKQRPTFSDEEAAAHFEIGRTYNREWRKKHDEFEGALQLKLDIQQFALKCLPGDLKAHATQLEDCPPPPLDRRFWSWTPPIPGFKPDDYLVGR